MMTMTMTDHVARMIAKGYKQMIANTPDGPADLLRQYIKAAVNHPHPRERVVMRYSINVGDVFRPLIIAPVIVAGEPVIIAPSQRYVIFKLSSPSSQYDLMERNLSEDPSKEVKAIILQYVQVEDELDVTKINSIVSCGSYQTIVSLLEICELVGNIAYKL